MKPVRIALVLLSLMVVSCTTTTINTDQYHGSTSTSQNQASNGPVAELQRQAIAALNQQQFDLAVGYLQRAIKIEPRNAFSWHYLAQSYWHKKSYSQCLDMVERAFSYSTVEDDLDRANKALKAQCQAH
jgi:Tfp pilus assembly protein PilF